MQKRSQNVYHCGMPRRASHLFSLDLSSSSSSFFPAVNYPGSLSQWSKTFLTTSPIGDTILSEAPTSWFLPIEPSDLGSKSIPHCSGKPRRTNQIIEDSRKALPRQPCLPTTQHAIFAQGISARKAIQTLSTIVHSSS